MPKVTIWRDGAIEMEFDPGHRDWRIGRSETNDITLLDPRKSVSRFHAELREESGRWVFTDLNSQNGSWKDGRRINRLVLEDGHEVLFGDYKFVFQDRKAALPPPVSAVDTAPAEPTDASLVPNETLLLPSVRGAASPGTHETVQPPIVRRAVKPSPLRHGLSPALLVLFLVAMLGGVAVVAWRVLADRRPTAPEPAPATEASAAATTSATTSVPAVTATDTPGTAIPSPESKATPPAPAPGVESPQSPAGPGARTSRADPPPSTRTRTTPPRPRRPPAPSKELPAVVARYQEGRRALAERRYVDAQRAFEAVLAQQPDFRDARVLLAQARRDAAAQESVIAEARGLEASGEWAAAVAAYERAGAASLAAAARQKMHAAGDDAYRKARQFDARDRPADAVSWYQHAIAWLPDGDPRRATARDRLAVLKGGAR
jgi:hypothetical protein